ncbi:DUF4142 domain-containing protein [Chitinophaga sp.]|uniref:DUF4142 domain-containing protein n=1 Tax=Chitinophaga sp. TaxID=1869181 RepID=UPI0031D5FDF8
MKGMQLLVAAALMAVSCGGEGPGVNPPVLTEHDRTFAIEASYGNYAEADLGTVADTISTNDSVSAFARMMVADHNAAQTELENITSAWPVNLPEGPDSLHRALKQQLLTLQGLQFDTTYMNAQITDHERAVALYQKAADSSRVGALRAYAAKYLPGIRMHLEQARTMRQQLR